MKNSFNRKGLLIFGVITLILCASGITALAYNKSKQTVTVTQAVYQPARTANPEQSKADHYQLALNALQSSQWVIAKNELQTPGDYRDSKVLLAFANAEDTYSNNKDAKATLDILKDIPSDYSGDLKDLVNKFKADIVKLNQPQPTVTQQPAQKATSTKTTSPKATTQTPVQSDLIVNRLRSIGNAQQVILVTASDWGTYHATIETFEKVNGVWQRKFPAYNGVVGKKGFSSNRHEGDYTTPTGTYTFGTAFGTGGNPGLMLSYRQSLENKDFWVTDTVPERYNVWIHREEGPDPNWKDFEYMYQPLYKYGAVINFNMDPGKIIGKGAGIFFHIAPSSGLGTAGCVATSESNLLKTLRWMNPGKNPVIVMGPKFLVDQM